MDEKNVDTSPVSTESRGCQEFQENDFVFEHLIAHDMAGGYKNNMNYLPATKIRRIRTGQLCFKFPC